MATNGPWLSMIVDGLGTGETLDGPSGRTVHAVLDVTGPGVESVELRTAAGIVASAPISGDHGHLEVDLEVTEPTFLVAVAHGRSHPDVLQECVYAHTSPAYLNVGARSVARREDAEWCIDWLSRLERLVLHSGVFSTAQHRDDVLEVIDRARRVYEAVARGEQSREQ